MPLRIEPDEPDDVRVALGDEIGDAFEYLAAAAQVAGAGHRQVESRAGPGRVSDVVDEQSHQQRRYPRSTKRRILGAGRYWRRRW
jgi:hypothetical protein